VKCDGFHLTYECPESNDKSLLCTLCGGPYPANYRRCLIYTSFQQRNYYNWNSIIKPAHTQNQNIISKENYGQVPIGNASFSNNSNMPGDTTNYATALKNSNSNDIPKNHNIYNIHPPSNY